MVFLQLEAKRINGRSLTAPELRNYASAYVELFHNGAHFPAARSLLEATAGAHNGNAKHVALRKYKVWRLNMWLKVVRGERAGSGRNLADLMLCSFVKCVDFFHIYRRINTHDMGKVLCRRFCCLF